MEYAGSKVTPLIRMPLTLSFPPSRLFSHHHAGVTLGRTPSAEMLLLLLKHLLLTKKVTNALSVPRRVFFYHQQSWSHSFIEDPAGDVRMKPALTLY